MRRGSKCTIACLALASTLSVGYAAQHQFRVYPKPELRAFSLAQAPDGFLWLAAADGLYRFDGFHYQRIRTFPLASARFLSFAEDGSLWIADYQGLVHLNGSRFDKILNQPIDGITAIAGQLFVQPGGPEARIALDGSIHTLNYRVRRELNPDRDGKLWGVCMAPTMICWIDPKNPETPHPVKDADDFFQVVPDAKGRLWVADNEHAEMLENGHSSRRLKRHATAEGNRSGSLLKGRNGHIWFLGEAPRELASNLEFRDRADHDRFAPLAGVEDSAGH